MKDKCMSQVGTMSGFVHLRALRLLLVVVPHDLYSTLDP